MAAYETYETDKDYDTMEMQNTQAAERAPVAVPPVMKGRGHRKFKITLVAMFLVLLLLIGGVVGLLLKSNLETPVDCDVGPWGEWTSCYLPPDMCGVGSKDRSREQIAEAQHHGEKCAKPRIIELMESQACNVECKSPVDCKVGPWEEWSSCSVTCGEGTRDRAREKLADAAHNGEMCSSTRIISLKEQDTCNEQPCEIGQMVSCGNHQAASCADCPQNGFGASYFNGDCTWRNGSCVSGEVIFKGQMVSCGNHEAASCADCPQNGFGASYCNGDCTWSNGNCVSGGT